MNTLRIFISSPSDVQEERTVAGRVIERLQGKYWSFVRLDDVFWENKVVRATAHFQDELVNPGNCDLVIGILWSRLGSPLPEKFQRLAGAARTTGTEWELMEAFSAYEKSLAQTGDALAAKPDVVVYRRQAPPIADDDASRRQREILEAFVTREFFNADGTFRRAINDYRDPGEFEAKLAGDLEQLILRRIPALKPGFEPPPISGAPFKDLTHFDFADSDRFFGRNRAIRELQQQLAARAAEGMPFVLIYGGSGYGKSSLMRAGLAPVITRPGGALPGMDRWRRVLLQPGKGGGPLCERLARVLLAAPVADDFKQQKLHEHWPLPGLPELTQTTIEPDDTGEKWDAASLARMLADDTKLFYAAAGVARTLDRIGHWLLLQIDQLEEVFPGETVTAAEREAFFKAIAALTRTGRVWTVATMRSEYFPRIAETPALAALVGKNGGYILAPPSEQELREIIRFPALAARLDYERATVPRQIAGALATAEHLDEQILADAAGSPDALPLLEFTLHKLYAALLGPGERRTGELLRWDTYAAFGGLKGAIASTAEETFAALDPAANAACDALFGNLVRVDAGSRDVVTRKRPALSDLRTAAPGTGGFLDSFLAARLLVTDEEAGHPVVTLAHEALITHWPRLAEWVAHHRAILRSRQRLEENTRQWIESGRAKKLLLAEGRLAEAESVEKCGLFQLAAEERTLIAQSRGQARSRLHFFQAAAAVFALVALLAAVLGYVAQKRKIVAETRERDARSALAAETLALSRSHYAKAAELIESDKALEAGAFLARAHRLLPDDRACWALMHSLLTQPPPSLPIGKPMIERGELDARPMLSNDSSHLLMQTGFSVAVFDISSGERVYRAGAIQGYWAGCFSPDGPGTIVSSQDGMGHVYFPTFPGDSAPEPFFRGTAAARNEMPMFGNRLRFGRKLGSLINLSGGMAAKGAGILAGSSGSESIPLPGFVIGRDDGEPRLLDLGSSPTSVAVTSPVADLLLTGLENGGLSVWNIATGEKILEDKLDGRVTAGEFTRDGTRLLAVSRDHRVHAYDLRTRKKLFATAWSKDLNDIALSADDTVAAIGGDDGLALINPATGAELTPRIKLNAGVTALAIEPAGQRLIAGASNYSVDSVEFFGRVWQRRRLTFVQEKPEHVAFLPGGTSYLTVTRNGLAQKWPLVRDNLASQSFETGGTVKTVRFFPDGNGLLALSHENKTKSFSVHWIDFHAKEARVASRMVPDGKTATALWCLKNDAGLVTCSNGEVFRVRKNGNEIELQLLKLDIPAGVICAVPAFASSPKTLFLPCLDVAGMMSAMQTIGDGDPLSRSGREVFKNAAAKMHSDIRAVPLSADFDDEPGNQTVIECPGMGVAASETGQVIASVDPTGRLNIRRRQGDSWISPGLREAAAVSNNGPGNSASVGFKIAMSAEGGTLAVGTADHRLLVLRIGDHVDLIHSIPHGKSITAIAITRDGTFAALGDRDGALRIIDLTTGADVAAGTKHNGGNVNSLQFSADGEWLLSGGDDSKARLWHTKSGRPTSAPMDGGSDVNHAVFSPNEETVALAVDNGEVRRFGVALHAPGPPAWVPELLECLAGFRIGEKNDRVPVPPEELHAWRDRLGSLVNDSLWGRVAGGMLETNRRVAPQIEIRLSAEYAHEASVALTRGKTEWAAMCARRVRQFQPDIPLATSLDRLAVLGELSAAEPFKFVDDEHKPGEALRTGVGIAMRWCPAGRALVGSPFAEVGRGGGESQYHLILPNGFWMAQTETTQAQWRETMGESAVVHAKKQVGRSTEFQARSGDRSKTFTIASHHGLKQPEDLDRLTPFFGDDLPMFFVTWADANEFCRALTDRERRAGTLRAGWAFRLPTEAEWEFACRAGSATATYAGDLELLGRNNAPVLNGIAWYGGNSSTGYTDIGANSKGWSERAFPGDWAGPHGVGKLKPNAWGLHDMLGNVSEWCSDPSDGADFNNHVAIAPRAGNGTDRICRGGNWISTANVIRAGFRKIESPGWCDHSLGFRVVLAPISEAEMRATGKAEAFYYQYNHQPEPGLRVWNPGEGGVWTETYPSGKQDRFSVLQYAEVDGHPGVLLRKQEQVDGVWRDGTNFEIFFHVPGAEKPGIYFRTLGENGWGRWSFLATITFGKP